MAPPFPIWACAFNHDYLDFGQAEAQFKNILALDKYRLDDIDVYSNILYVNENRLELSKLAHDFLALDKDRPEVCCLVGTYSHDLRIAMAHLGYTQGTITPCGVNLRELSNISNEPPS